MSQNLTMSVPIFSTPSTSARRSGAGGVQSLFGELAGGGENSRPCGMGNRLIAGTGGGGTNAMSPTALWLQDNLNGSSPPSKYWASAFSTDDIVRTQAADVMHGGPFAHTPSDILASQATQVAAVSQDPENLCSPIISQLPSDMWGRLVPIEDFAKTEATSKNLSGSGAFRIGRGSASNLQLNELTVSSRHCSIVYDEVVRAPCIVDHKSSNGTFINSEKVEPERKYYLSHGDIVSLVAPAKSFAQVLSSSTGDGNAKKQKTLARAAGFSMMFHSYPPPIQFAEEAYKKAPKEFASKFAIVEALGKGNFATVYRAISRSNGESVAVKVIERSRFLSMSPQRWAQQVKEAELLQRLEHPGIAAFRSLVHTPDSIYLVTELLEGGELFDRLVRAGAYTEANARLLMRRVIEAVAYLHERGIVHRDLKPENLVLKRKGDDLDVKLVDFGVATELSGKGSRTFCGSMSYVAPEVLKRRISVEKQGTYGKGVDMWSIGVIAHVVLTVRPPFDEEDQDQIHAALPTILKFQGSEWKHISQAAKNFIRACFELREDKRITAKGALQHEWLRMDA